MTFVKYHRKPEAVAAVQITADNIDAIAKAIGGRVVPTRNTVGDITKRSLVFPTTRSEQNIIAPGGYLTFSYEDNVFRKCDKTAFEMEYVPVNDLDDSPVENPLRKVIEGLLNV